MDFFGNYTFCYRPGYEKRYRNSKRKRIDDLNHGNKIHFELWIAVTRIYSKKLSEENEYTLVKLSILKTGKAKAIRFGTLEAICEALDGQPGDILKYSQD